MKPSIPDLPQTILHSIGVGITVQDKSGKFLYMNKAAAHMMGLDSVDNALKIEPRLISAKYKMLDIEGNPFDLSQLPGRVVLRGGKKNEAIIQSIHVESGRKRWSLIKAIPIYDRQKNVKYVINTVYDITEKKSEEESVDRFVATASHEFKTPLASIKALNQLIAKRNQEQSYEKIEYFSNKIDEKVNDLTKLINDFLDTAKIRAGTMSFHPEYFDFDFLIKEIVEDMRTIGKTHTFIVKGHTNATLFGDKQRIRQAITNLVRNAKKYSAKANKINITLAKSKGYVQVDVEDFGIGISDEDIQHIFVPYFRASTPYTGTGGLGLGLFIAHHIVEAHKGKIHVKSTKGKGSTFSVLLPTKMNEQKLDIQY